MMYGNEYIEDANALAIEIPRLDAREIRIMRALWQLVQVRKGELSN